MRWGNGYHRERRAHARPDDDRSAFRDAVLFLWIVALIFAAAAVQ